MTSLYSGPTPMDDFLDPDDADRVILRRFTGDIPTHGDPQRLAEVALVVDVETTGLSFARDAIIELAWVKAQVDTDGAIVRILDRGHAYHDPGIPISPAITALTGISEADVAGNSIGYDLVTGLLADTDVIVAHNAEFDFGFLSRFDNRFAGFPWMCSLRDIAWRDRGVSTRSLEGIAQASCGLFYAAHRGLVDVEVLATILASPDPQWGWATFRTGLNEASKERFLLASIGSPYRAKDALRDAGCRWDSERKYWYQVARGRDEAQRVLSALQDIHQAHPACGVWVHCIDPRDRFCPEQWLIDPPVDAPYDVIP